MLSNDLRVVDADWMILAVTDVIVKRLAATEIGDDGEMGWLHARTHKQLEILVASLLVNHNLYERGTAYNVKGASKKTKQNLLNKIATNLKLRKMRIF